MNQKQPVRQGDVLFIPCRRLLSRGLKRRENGVVAYGEVTGHAHRLATECMAMSGVFECGNGLVVRVSEHGLALSGDPGATFIHEEHAPVHLLPGDYDVRIQREYDPVAIRKVAD